ncbi:unnamed protein product [Ectocarpus sp. 12 AP-2014]
MLEMTLIILPGPSALLDTSAVNECLDSTDVDRCQTTTTGSLGLRSCGITDADFDDLASCLEAAGPETITTLSLHSNDLTTLPEGIFGDLTTLQTLSLHSNDLTTLPEGIFENTTALQSLLLSSNELTTLPEGIFGGLTALDTLYLHNNNLTTLPEGVFGDLTTLTLLRLEENSLECLPSNELTEVDDDATANEDGLHVDAYGDECGCSIEGVIDNVCGQEVFTPGDEGYTCAAIVAPVPGPIWGTTAPESVSQPTQAPGSTSEEGASTVGVVVGVVADALALGALGFFLHRRRTVKSTNPDPAALPSNSGDSLEHGRGEHHQQRQQDLHSSSPMIASSAEGNVTRGPSPPAQQGPPLPPPPYADEPPPAHKTTGCPPPSYEHDDAHRRDAWPPAASQQHAAVAAEAILGKDGTPIQSLFPAPPVSAPPNPSSEGTAKRTRDNNESGSGTRMVDAGRGEGGGDAAEDGGGCVAAAE